MNNFTIIELSIEYHAVQLCPYGGKAAVTSTAERNFSRTQRYTALPKLQNFRNGNGSTATE